MARDSETEPRIQQTRTQHFVLTGVEWHWRPLPSAWWGNAGGTAPSRVEKCVRHELEVKWVQAMVNSDPHQVARMEWLAVSDLRRIADDAIDHGACNVTVGFQA